MVLVNQLFVDKDTYQGANMNEINQTLKLNQFKNRIIVVWFNVGTKQACIRDSFTGISKIITVKGE